MDALPRLLFISPTYPDTQGNGLAMRAGLFVEALAKQYRVTLLVVPLFARPTATAETLTARCCEETIVVDGRLETGFLGRVRERFDTRPWVMRQFARHTAACIEAIGIRHFDVIHAFRLYTAPLALAIAEHNRGIRRPELHLDVDDIESVTGRRMADLRRWNLEHERVALELHEAQRYEDAEARLLPLFDRVYACSGMDAERLRSFVTGDLRVAPNAVRIPEEPLSPRTTHPFTFLFVGNLGYYPNEDAAGFFCRRILPLVREAATCDLLVRIVGNNMPPALHELQRIDGVRLVGEVADVRMEYADADAVIVPIRGGGGTRIKVLEAFAHCRPVVSTPMGIEGIEATPEEHYLLGETPETFAAQCVRLLQDRDLGRATAGRAYSLVKERYTHEKIAKVIVG